MTAQIDAILTLLEKQADDDDRTLELMAQSHAVQKHTKGCCCAAIIESQRAAVANTRERLAAIRELAR